jgi:hypothetical protein
LQSLTGRWLARTIRTAQVLGLSMIPRAFLATFVFALPILIVTFGVVLAASALANALGDAAGARGLFWVAMGALMLLVVDALLLLVVLGIRALEERRDQD